MNLSSFYSVSHTSAGELRSPGIAYTQAPLLELHALAKTYRSGLDSAKVAVHGISLTVRRGEAVSILGPRGSGKSTLLNLLGGLETATSGRYFCAGVNVETLDASARARLRQRSIGFLFRMPHLLPRLNVLENVMLPLAYAELARARQHDAALTALGEVGMRQASTQMPAQLDPTEQQRVALARALVNRAPVLLADEPTGTLDANGTRELLALLRTLRDNGRTVLLVTESAAVAAHADRQFFMRDGRLYTPHTNEPLA